ncbi:MAG: cyclic nucleotide-binding domain-containing protein [Desulfobacterales bacterium]|nr:cyclic nucleotide-binding domain-containing protein [Desulfobacterales bacterium]
MDTILSQFPFFSGISRERQEEIESFAITQDYAQGETVFQSDEPARNLYGLLKGEVSLALVFREEVVTRNIKWEEYVDIKKEIFEKPVIIEEISPGNIFGWSALVEPAKMTAAAKCETDCQILLIPAELLKKVFEKDPELGYILSSRISDIIAGRLNTRTQKLVDAWCTLFENGSIGAV